MQFGDNLHVYVLRRSGNNVMRKLITHRRLMAIYGNIKYKNFIPGEAEFDAGGLKRPFPFPLTRKAVFASGSLHFKTLSRFPVPHYFGVEDRFVPMEELEHQKTTHVVLVRHIHHCLASRIQRGHQRNRQAYPIHENPELHRILDVWVQHVDLLVDPPPRVGGVNFNRWLQDAAYRIALGQKLGVRNASQLPTKRGTGGSGSSFDGMATVKNPMEMLRRANRLSGPDLELWSRCVNRPNVFNALARLETHQSSMKQ